MDDLELFNSLWAFDQKILDGTNRDPASEVSVKPLRSVPEKWDYTKQLSEPSIRWKEADERG